MNKNNTNKTKRKSLVGGTEVSEQIAKYLDEIGTQFEEVSKEVPKEAPPKKIKNRKPFTEDFTPQQLTKNIKDITPEKALEVATTIKSIQEAEVVEKNAENFGSFFMAVGSIVWFIIDNKECFGIKGDTDVFKIIIYTMFSLSAISTLVSSWFNIVKVKIENKNHIISKSILIVMFMMAKILFFIMWALSISYNTDTENTNTSTVECKNEFKIVLWLFIGLVVLYSGFSWIYFRDSAAGNIANLFAGG